MKRVAIICLDTFRHKNTIQLEIMNQVGYYYDVFVTDSAVKQQLYFASCSKNNRLIMLQSNFLLRLKQLFLFLKHNRYKLNHIEVYVGGRFTIFYLLLAKMFHVKVLVVERGDIQFLFQRNWLLKKFYIYVYRNADLVWYKEPYMQQILKNIKVENTYFIPNSVKIVDGDNNNHKIDFLWVNRNTKERNVNWLLKYAHMRNNQYVCILGISNKQDGMNEELMNLISKSNSFNNLVIRDYTDPMPYIKQAKFFILISENFVFGNYALLEAMAYGLVPIVTKTKYTDLIVQDKLNGITFDYDINSFFQAMDYANSLNDEDYNLLSKNAKNYLKLNYSIENWQNKVNDLYKEIKTVV